MNICLLIFSFVILNASMHRDIVDQLRQWRVRSDRKPLILRGARQVGKTFIIKRFGESSFAALHYFNFEEDERLLRVFEADLRPDRILDELQFLCGRAIDRAHDLVVFDEIQQCSRALTSLKYFNEDCPQLAICAAGSLLGLQLGTESFPVGKVEFLPMFPMSFGEFLQAVGAGGERERMERHDLREPLPEAVHGWLWNEFLTYLVVGGLPGVVAAYVERRADRFLAIDAARERQRQLVLAYMADMAKHAGKQNSMHLERLWRNVPAQLARMQDGGAPKFTFKGVIPGIKGYSRLAGTIDWLLAAGLLIKVEIVDRADIPLAAFADESVFKLYAFDVGILGALAGLPAKSVLDYDYGTFKGYMAESFVAQEFVARNSGPLYCWRGRTSEVEFVRECNGEVVPVEVKSGWVTGSKSLSVFRSRYACPFAAVLSGRNIRRGDQVRHIPLYMAARFPFE